MQIHKTFLSVHEIDELFAGTEQEKTLNKLLVKNSVCGIDEMITDILAGAFTEEAV